MDLIKIFTQFCHPPPSREVVNTQGRESWGSWFETCCGVWYPRRRPCDVAINTLVNLINWLGNPKFFLSKIVANFCACQPPFPLWQTAVNYLPLLHRRVHAGTLMFQVCTWIFSLSKQVCTWIFSLSKKTDQPVSPSLRNLSRNLAVAASRYV